MARTSVDDNCFIFQGVLDLIIPKVHDEDEVISLEVMMTGWKILMQVPIIAGELSWAFKCPQPDHTVISDNW